MAIPLLDGISRPRRLVADKAYDADSLRTCPVAFQRCIEVSRVDCHHALNDSAAGLSR